MRTLVDLISDVIERIIELSIYVCLIVSVIVTAWFIYNLVIYHIKENADSKLPDETSEIQR